MEKVTVLMSTYNGQKFIKEQIDSILNQNDVQVQLNIRDDGSTDRTIAILKEYQNRFDNINVVFGKNIGWKLSFFSLLRNVVAESGTYYAFSDQDDIWKKNKLKNAIDSLTDDKPMVYHSNVTVVDSNGRTLSNRFSKNFRPSTKIPEAFFDSFALGCTMVFNLSLLELTKMHIPSVETQHDAYVFALGYLLGSVVYDPEPRIFYRRHESATSGFQKISKDGKPSLLMRYRKYKNGPKNSFSIRAREVSKGYDNILSSDKVILMNKISNYQNDIKYKFELLVSPKMKATGIRKTLQIKYRIFNNTL